MKTFLGEMCQDLLEHDGLTEGVESALPYGVDSDSTEIVVDIMRSIVEIGSQ